MKLFNSSQIATINQVAQRTKESLKSPKKLPKNITNELQLMQQQVLEYFKDSDAILITSRDQLHDYVSEVIRCGYAGYDTETTGLDRIHDTIVGCSLYYPGGKECYIPNKHIVPIFDQPYKGQLTYQDVHDELLRLVDNKIKLFMANADFDIAMTYKDYKVDLIDICYYDVILAWRCIKEDELHNDLKSLYMKYVMKGQGDPKKFSDFFTPALFPYCKPEIAKLYAAHDAKITFDLGMWQLPYVTKTHKKCQKHHFESISDLVWNIEFPLIEVCAELHRCGMYLDKPVSDRLMKRYHNKLDQEVDKLKDMVQEIINTSNLSLPSSTKRPFVSGKDFNPKSPLHVKFLLYTLMKLPQDKDAGTGKEVLADINLPVTNQILKVSSLNVLIDTFVDKLPNSTTPDSRIHALFRSTGAATGRFSSAEPNLMNIPSRSVDIRHMFRATPQTNVEYLSETFDENKIEFTLPRYYKTRCNDEYTECDKLNINDQIQLEDENHRYITCKLIDKSDVDSDVSMIKLTFEIAS